MFNDLVAVTSPAGDFKFLRQEVEATIEAKPIIVGPKDASIISTDGQSTANRKAAGDGKVQPRAACIPFLGMSCLFTCVNFCPFFRRNLSFSALQTLPASRPD